MANWYVRSGAGGTGAGTSWTNAFTTLTLAFAAGAAGDTFYVADDHAETSASVVTLTSPGTAANPCLIICVSSHATSPPTAHGTGATVSTTSNSAMNFAGFAYCYGIKFQCGSGAVNANITMQPASTFGWRFDTCAFVILCTGNTSKIIFGLGASGSMRDFFLSLSNCTFQFSNASQGIVFGTGRSSWTNTPNALVSGTLPTVLFINGTGSGGILDISGVDLSALGSGKTLVNVGTALQSSFDIYFRNCKLGASVAVTTGSIQAPGAVRVFLENCDSGNTNYRMEHYKYAGSIVQETTIVRSGGASDGVTTLSWKMASIANTRFRWPLASQPIDIWLDTTGSSKTLTLEFVHDNVTALNNNEIWSQLEYMGTSSLPLSVTADNRMADEFATPAAQASSAASWTTTGLSNPNTQKLAITITAQMKGWCRLNVMLAKQGYTVYVDPKVTVS